MSKFTALEDGTILGVKGFPLKPKGSGGKYLKVSYQADNGKIRHKYVHRLVAESHVPNPNNHRYVNHIDGNPHNNHKDNLEWCSARQNTQHAIANGLLYNLPKKGQQGFQCAN